MAAVAVVVANIAGVSAAAVVNATRCFEQIKIHGDPGESRTPDLMLRRHLLYPAELRGRMTHIKHSCLKKCNKTYFYAKDILCLYMNFCAKTVNTDLSS